MTTTDAAASPPPSPSPTARDRYVQVMKALSDPTRLEMLQLIGGEPEYACTSLEKHLAVGKSTISYHVKILSHAGLVSVRREGRHFFYSLHREVLDYFAPGLLDRLAAEGTALSQAE